MWTWRTCFQHKRLHQVWAFCCSQAVQSGAAEGRAALICRAPVWLLPVKIQTAQNSRIPRQEALPGRKVPSFCLVLVWLHCQAFTPECISCSALDLKLLRLWNSHITPPVTPPADQCRLLHLTWMWLPVLREGGMTTFKTHTSPHQFSCTTGKPHALLEVELFNISLTEWIIRFSSTLLCTDAFQGGLFW